MTGQIRIARIQGIDIGLHYSWFVIATLITMTGWSRYEQIHPEWGSGLILTMSLVTGALFFVSIVVHELSHSLVARRHGLPVRSITLFALGGVARIEREPAEPKTEFWMAIVGPITSFLIGALFLGAAFAAGWGPLGGHETPVAAMLGWLGWINVSLAIFNMIPGFPMDGGRVLRSIVWWATGDPVRATRVAARGGQIVAGGLIALGVVGFFRPGGSIASLWPAFIGWFLLDAARGSVARVEVASALKGVRVGDIMSRDCPWVSSRVDLRTFVDEVLIRTGRRCFLVIEKGQIVGVVTPEEIRQIERERWPFLQTGDVMMPIERMRRVTPETPVTTALETIGQDEISQLPVVSGGRLRGIISRAHVLNYLQTRAEFQH